MRLGADRFILSWTRRTCVTVEEGYVFGFAVFYEIAFEISENVWHARGFFITFISSEEPCWPSRDATYSESDELCSKVVRFDIAIKHSIRWSSYSSSYLYFSTNSFSCIEGSLWIMESIEFNRINRVFIDV